MAWMARIMFQYQSRGSLMIRFVYKILPVLVIYTDYLPKRFSGYCLGFIVLIRPGARGDTGLLEHELVHSRQFYRTLGVYSILVWISKRYLFKTEIEAYATQLRYSEDLEILRFSKFIAENYGLNVSIEEAEDALRDYFKRNMK